MKIFRVLGHPGLTLVYRLVLGYVFLTYGLEKIFLSKDFAHNIMNYELMPHAWVNIAALVMPWVEVFAGLQLIVGLRVRSGALLSASMLVMFMMAISIAMARGLEINCGCSAHPEPVGFPKLAEDTGFLVLSLLLFFFPDSWLSLERYLGGSSLRAESDQHHEALPTA